MHIMVSTSYRYPCQILVLICAGYRGASASFYAAASATKAAVLSISCISYGSVNKSIDILVTDSWQPIPYKSGELHEQACWVLSNNRLAEIMTCHCLSWCLAICLWHYLWCVWSISAPCHRHTEDFKYILPKVLFLQSAWPLTDICKWHMKCKSKVN